MTEQPQKKEIKVEFPPSLRGGAYCNNLIVTHTKEEFVMDFMMIVPPTGAVTARVIMSPGHMKRTALALQQNLKKYEERFGTIKQAEEPSKGRLGFHTS